MLTHKPQNNDTYLDRSSSSTIVCPSSITTRTFVPSSNSSNSISSHSVSSSNEFSNVSDLLKTYNNFESFIQQHDGKQRLKEYLESLRNEEQLLFVEIMEPFMTRNLEILNKENINSSSRTCEPSLQNQHVSTSTRDWSEKSNSYYYYYSELIMNQENEWPSNDIIMESVKNASRHRHGHLQPSSSLMNQTMLMNLDINTTNSEGEPHWTSLCQVVFTQFLKDDSPHQLNVSSKLKTNVKQASLSNCEQEAKKALTTLYHEVLSQMKEEAFHHLRKSEDFKIWILSKAIEFSQKAEQYSVQTFLEENEMAENWPLFKKKKLCTMKDIREMTEDDFRKLGVKKLGHLKRLVRKTTEHFMCSVQSTSLANQ
ncbi:hypothetical protein C9374_007920 [Naegleria lovaniensis]|uniref:SAM domain-containing protein n=1 Tax=Naegleria lovaniensis TaxID=51637 RepID=A0AA88GG07_NAELO|nr:uncharacterized protein C9374_007920 [Naegleria lovaniensis]KAG2378772.1 hypothetical protein C9374_007920 [Naegleria lovaniensis]